MSSSETIEVCQECGRVVDPIRVPSPLEAGVVYEIRLCLRDDCIADRLQRVTLAEIQQETADRMAAWRMRWMMPVVNSPTAFISVTGV